MFNIVSSLTEALAIGVVKKLFLKRRLNGCFLRFRECSFWHSADWCRLCSLTGFFSISFPSMLDLFRK